MNNQLANSKSMKYKQKCKTCQSLKASFSEREPNKNYKAEQLVEMEIFKKINEKEASFSKNDMENNNNTVNSRIFIEELRRENQNLKDELYFQKKENKKLRDIIKKMMKEQTHQHIEPKIPQDFVPALKTEKFSKYFKNDDEKYDPLNIEIIQIPSNNGYSFWSFESFINTQLHMMNIFFKKVEVNSKITAGLQKLNHKILNKSEYLMKIQNIEIESTDSIYSFYIIFNKSF